MTNLDLDVRQPVSYTHLDVYKRQTYFRYFDYAIIGIDTRFDQQVLQFPPLEVYD